MRRFAVTVVGPDGRLTKDTVDVYASDPAEARRKGNAVLAREFGYDLDVNVQVVVDE